MSVIGRLDGQVEQVIINPIGRRPAGEDDAPPTQPAPPEPPETATPAPRGGQSGDNDEAAELPVWLL